MTESNENSLLPIIHDHLYKFTLKLPIWLQDFSAAVTWPVAILIIFFFIKDQIRAFIHHVPGLADKALALFSQKALPQQQNVSDPKELPIKSTQDEKPSETEDEPPLTTPTSTEANSAGKDINDVKDHFIKLFPNEPIEEIAVNFRKTNPYISDPNLTGEYFLRVAAGINIFYIHEKNYRMIFGSQLSLLKSLNTGSLNISFAQNEYNLAKKKYSSAYKELSFDSWLKFLTTSGLCEKDGDTLKITKAGKSFLVYLTTNGIPDVRIL